MYEKFGFYTKRLRVLKAHEEDAREISKLYKNFSVQQRQIIERNWRNQLYETAEDLYQDVTFIVRDKCNKVLGIVETESEDRERVKISIWFINKLKEATYLDELVDSMIEWSETDEYKVISGIQLINEVNLLCVVGTDLRGEIVLNSAS